MGCISDALALSLTRQNADLVEALHNGETVRVVNGCILIDGSPPMPLDPTRNVRSGYSFPELEQSILNGGLTAPLVIEEKHHQRRSIIKGLLRPMVVKTPRVNNSMRSRRPILYHGK